MCAVRAIRSLGCAMSLRHSNRSFRDHLVGTWNILTAWNQPHVICRAGLLHSAYSTSFYPHALFAVTKRQYIRDLVGRRAEALVFKFCAIDRRSLWDLLPLRPVRTGIVVESRFDPERRIRLTRADVEALAIIESANIAEQTRSVDDGPATWMSEVFDLWRRVRGRTRLRRAKAAQFTWRREAASIVLYRQACRMRPMQASEALDAAIGFNPWAAEPRVLRAILALTAGDARRCRKESRRALELLRLWHTAWDKRASLDQWKAFGESLRRAGKGAEVGPTVAVFRMLVRGRCAS